MAKRHYVYIGHSRSFNAYKVGHSSNPSLRMLSLVDDGVVIYQELCECKLDAQSTAYVTTGVPTCVREELIFDRWYEWRMPLGVASMLGLRGASEWILPNDLLDRYVYG